MENVKLSIVWTIVLISLMNPYTDSERFCPRKSFAWAMISTVYNPQVLGFNPDKRKNLYLKLLRIAD